MIDEYGDLGICKHDHDLANSIIDRCAGGLKLYGEMDLARMVATFFLEMQKDAHDQATIMEWVLDVVFQPEWIRQQVEGPQHVMQ